MHGLKRTVATLAAGGTAVLAAWMFLVTWASTAGLYENTLPAGRAELWFALVSMLVALGAVAFTAFGRLRAGLSLTVAAVLMQVGVVLTSGS